MNNAAGNVAIGSTLRYRSGGPFRWLTFRHLVQPRPKPSGPEAPLRGEPVSLAAIIRRAHGMPVEKTSISVEDERPSGLGRKSSLVLRVGSVASLAAFFTVVAGLGWALTEEGSAAGDGAALPAIAAAAEAAPSGALVMGPVTTGVAAVDDALRGFLLGDPETAASHLIVRDVPCGVLPWGGFPALPCLPKQPPGTVRAVVLAGCQPTWMAPAAAAAELQTLLLETPGVHSIARSGQGYASVLSWPDAPERTLVLNISSAGITSFSADCGPATSSASGYALKFARTP
jgi:hypothetical protein